MLASRPAPTETTRTARPGSTTGTSGATPSMLPAERVGRFEVQRCIGMGGMGQVYAARDPQLDRTVALKVLHADRDRRQDPRLIREAQALARLSHPNVVAVHEAGVHRGRLFLAMEFVEGMTLRAWLQQYPAGSPGQLAAVLDAMIQAGRGLAAAHRAGLVHRDFKPGNVLIGHDGRVRVADFGLVRVAAPLSSTTQPASGDPSCSSSTTAGEPTDNSADETSAAVDFWGLLDQRPLTRPGALVGTPAYMAPEQLLGERVDASTDQFGFCLTLWEAIFGVRVFPGRSIPEVLRKMRWRRPARPKDVACPREVELALRCGLAFNRGRRHRSMDDLLDVLSHARDALLAPPQTQRRASPRWPAVLAFGGGLASMAAATGAEERRLCSSAEEQLAGIWDEPVKHELEQAFQRSGDPGAAEHWPRFEHAVDAYVRRWQAGHRDACEATEVHHEQSIERMHLRMACLDARRQALAGLVEAHRQVDTGFAERAAATVVELPSVEHCAERELVRRWSR